MRTFLGICALFFCAYLGNMIPTLRGVFSLVFITFICWCLISYFQEQNEIAQEEIKKKEIEDARILKLAQSVFKEKDLQKKHIKFEAFINCIPDDKKEEFRLKYLEQISE